MKISISLLSVLLVLALTSCAPTGAASTTNAASNAQRNTESAQNNTAAENSGSEDSELQNPAVIELGETAKFSNWEVTPESFVIATEVSSSYITFSPDEGNRYFVSEMTVKNVGKEAALFLPPIYNTNKDLRITVWFDNEYEFSSATLLAHTEDLHSKTLNPLTSKTGILAFQLPIEVIEDTEKSLVMRISLGKDFVDYSIR